MKKKRSLDKFTVFVRIMDLTVFGTIFTALVFLNQGKPETQTIFDTKYDKVARTTWLTDDVQTAFTIMIVAAVIATIGLIINLGFIGNKKYHMSVGMVLGLIISILCLIWIGFSLL